jgi:heterodisulfide reductase subunit A-like polyferredoxin
MNQENSKSYFDLIVIGAGAAGMMCAATAGQRGKRVLLIDHAVKLAEKYAFLAEVVATLRIYMPDLKIFYQTILIFVKVLCLAIRRRIS